MYVMLGTTLEVSQYMVRPYLILIGNLSGNCFKMFYSIYFNRILGDPNYTENPMATYMSTSKDIIHCRTEQTLIIFSKLPYMYDQRFDNVLFVLLKKLNIMGTPH